MIARRSLIAAGIALALTACQGGFGGTSSPGVNPPVNPPPAGALGPATVAPLPSPSGSPGIPPGSTASYAFTSAAQGFQCPQVDGFTCFIRLNMPQPSPSPSPSSGASAARSSATPSPTPSPTPTPTPTPSPSPAPSGSGLPSAAPSAVPDAGPQITLALEALPKNAPAMVNPDPKAVATDALLAVRLHANADVALHGRASADFTLPKEQIGGRGFAIQLFHESTNRHKKVTETYLGSYAKSTLKGTTLHFDLALPQITVKKNEVWLFVLYGDERPSATGAASPSPGASSAGSPAPSGSPQPTPSTAPDASPAPSST